MILPEALLVPKTYIAAVTCTIKEHDFLGFPHWWKYLGTENDPLGHCVPKVRFPDSLLAIGLAVIDMLLYLAGLAAVFFMVYAGVTYMLAEGNPEKAAAARKRIASAAIGLIVALTAIVFVRFIGRTLG